MKNNKFKFLFSCILPLSAATPLVLLIASPFVSNSGSDNHVDPTETSTSLKDVFDLDDSNGDISYNVNYETNDDPAFSTYRYKLTADKIILILSEATITQTENDDAWAGDLNVNSITVSTPIVDPNNAYKWNFEVSPKDDCLEYTGDPVALFFKMTSKTTLADEYKKDELDIVFDDTPSEKQVLKALVDENEDAAGKNQIKITDIEVDEENETGTALVKPIPTTNIFDPADYLEISFGVITIYDLENYFTDKNLGQIVYYGTDPSVANIVEAAIDLNGDLGGIINWINYLELALSEDESGVLQATLTVSESAPTNCHFVGTATFTYNYIQRTDIADIITITDLGSVILPDNMTQEDIFAYVIAANSTSTWDLEEVLSDTYISTRFGNQHAATITAFDTSTLFYGNVIVTWSDVESDYTITGSKNYYMDTHDAFLDLNNKVNGQLDPTYTITPYFYSYNENIPTTVTSTILSDTEDGYYAQLLFQDSLALGKYQVLLIASTPSGGFVTTTIWITVLDAPAYTIKNDEQLADWKFYNEGSTTSHTLNNSINLQQLSINHSDATYFVIEGTLTHALFIPSDFSCTVLGAPGSKININEANCDNAFASGIVVGNDTPNQTNANIGKDIVISENTILCPSSKACAIFFNNTISGQLTISNNTISSKTTEAYAYSIYFYNTISGQLTISNNTISSSTPTGLQSEPSAIGIFFDYVISTDAIITISNNTISSSTSSSYTYACPILFNYVISSDAIIIISNNTISSSSSSSNTYARAIFFYNTISGQVTISNNTISSSSSSSVTSIWFFYSISDDAIITISNNTIYSLTNSSNYGYAIFFNNTISGQVIISNNIISSYATSSSTYGIYFHNTISGQLTISNNTIFSVTYPIYFYDTISGQVTISNNTISVLASNAKGIWFSNVPTAGKIINSTGNIVFGWNSTDPGTNYSEWSNNTANYQYFGSNSGLGALEKIQTTWLDTLSNRTYTFTLYAYNKGTASTNVDQQALTKNKLNSQLHQAVVDSIQYAILQRLIDCVWAQ